MNREQIIKALECCTSGTSTTACDGCPLRYEEGTCDDDSNYLLKQALSLIREQEIELEAMRTAANSLKMHYEKLAEENESLKQAMEHEHASFMETFGEYGEKCERLTEENDRLRADTVQEIQVRLAMHFGTYTDKTEVKVSDVFKVLSRIAKELLQGDTTDTCVSCGQVIPEGRQVCPNCEGGDNEL